MTSNASENRKFNEYLKKFEFDVKMPVRQGFSVELYEESGIPCYEFDLPDEYFDAPVEVSVKYHDHDTKTLKVFTYKCELLNTFTDKFKESFESAGLPNDPLEIISALTKLSDKLKADELMRPWLRMAKGSLSDRGATR